MALTDLILFPLYVVFFHLLFAARRKRIEDEVLRKYHRQAFWIKVLGTVAFTFFHVFVTIGDSTVLYYNEGINITKLIFKDISNIELLFSPGKNFDENLLADSFNKGYFKNESNYFVTKLVSFFSFFTFGSYSVINLVFSMISFSGVWRLYKFFYEQYPRLHKQLAIAIIYLPNFVFWSSGILKDPLCTGMLGWFTYAVYRAFVKGDGVLKNILVALIAGYILALVKSYILAAYVPFFVLYIILNKVQLMKRPIVKLAALFAITFLISVAMLLLADRIQNMLGNLAIDKLAESVKTTQENFENISSLAASSFSLGVEFDGTASSLLKVAPASVTATLFRPFLWESKKLSTLLSSLESLAFMLFTLYVLAKARLKFFTSIFTQPVIMYCFWYALLFAMFIGTTTLNFGTLVRYKIPCVPFYLIALILILHRCKKPKSDTPVASDTALA
ncbi:MAG: hypothetical protein RL172_842 [Bacteroidota bacterium]|jgi:hypothetical protein